MADLHLIWGGALALDATGDLLLVSGSEEGRQRVLRRLLSNPADLLFHPEYGAGLPAKVGQTTKAADLHATVRRQMFHEAVVQQDPPPAVTVQHGYLATTIAIQYTDAETGQPVGIGFTVER